MKRTSVWIVGVTLLAVGCGSKATITGTVTYKGKPIPQGFIVFIPEKGGRPADAAIIDGKYTAEKVPTGPAKVTVTSMVMEGGGGPTGGMGHEEGAPPEMVGKMEGMPADAPIPPEGREMYMKGAASFTKAKQGMKIPQSYGDPEKSGLTYTVQPGAQTKDFKLE